MRLADVLDDQPALVGDPADQPATRSPPALAGTPRSDADGVQDPPQAPLAVNARRCRGNPPEAPR